jgi:hypothetical protein
VTGSILAATLQREEPALFELKIWAAQNTDVVTFFSLIVGFAAGFGVREAILRKGRREANRKFDRFRQ